MRREREPTNGRLTLKHGWSGVGAFLGKGGDAQKRRQRRGEDEQSEFGKINGISNVASGGGETAVNGEPHASEVI